MRRKTFICLTMVPGLVLTGCSGQSSDRGGERAATPSPSGSPTTTTSSSIDDVCRTVATAANSQLLTAALAVADRQKENSEVRAGVARSYLSFAAHLSLLTEQAPGNLRPALTEWASASTAVAHYIQEKKPRAGIVIDYGPSQKRWEAAKKAAEKVCGRPLPDLDE